MEKITQKIIATIMALVSLTCAVKAVKMKNTNSQEEKDISNISVMTTETDLEKTLKKNLYDENIDYITIINDYLDHNKNLSDIDFIKAIYMLIYHSDITMNDAIKEAIEYLEASVNSNYIEDYNDRFKSLKQISKTSGLSSDAYIEMGRLYEPFAAYTHSLDCSECSGLYNPDKGLPYECPRLKKSEVTNLVRK